ncbi:hypothetical protein A5733_01815 [Mycobacterium sp. NS-7484]|nr:hypothetical protein A5699_25585 [Mycobacterium sp. E802]OMB94964.1 hypothetical protein A5733_01815 [Mycobacterium sp. NS-7484]
MALVGASAIAVSPMAPPAPDVHLPAIQVSSASVALSAQANPLELWAEVIGAAFENIDGLGQQIAADPAPILTQIIANQLHTVNVLNGAAQTTINGLKEALGTEGWASFTNAFKDSLDLIAAGDFENGLGGVVSSLVLLALPLQTGIGQAWPAIAQPFVNLGQFVAKVNDNVPALLANGLLTPLMATAAATGHSIDSIVSAAKSADLAEFATALLNTPATVTGAFLNGYDVAGSHSAGFLTAAEGWLPGGAVATMIKTLSNIADSIKTPGADRGNLFRNLPGLTATPEAAAVNTTLVAAPTAVTLDVAPAKALTARVADAPAAAITTESKPAAAQAEKAESAPIAKADATSDTDAAAEGDTADDATTGVTKLSTKASPKAVKAQTKATSAKAVGDQVKSAVKKLTSGLKKDKITKKATEKKASSSASAKGSDDK